MPSVNNHDCLLYETNSKLLILNINCVTFAYYRRYGRKKSCLKHMISLIIKSNLFIILYILFKNYHLFV